jgi:hypothetical protein
VITVIVPAHNEAQVLGRLLGALASSSRPGELDVIVVANGCTDDTAKVAASFGPPVRVLSVPVPSKREALAAGDRAAKDFPRVYLDADVELGMADVRALCEALHAPGVLAVAPEAEHDVTTRPWLVRWYYDVWTRLPEVRRGLFGRGVVAVGEPGHARIASLPPVLADDLAASLSFAPDERAVARDAKVVVHTPRTVTDLMRRRVRAVVSVAQIERVEGAPPSTARTRPADLLEIARGGSWMTLHVMAFLAVTAMARLRARRVIRRGDYSTWLRDDSSRR